MSTWPPAPPPGEGPGDRPPSTTPPPPPPPPTWGGSPGWTGPTVYGQPQGAAPATSSTNQLCLVSMILGISSIVGAGCCVILGVPLALGGVVTGILGLSQVKDRTSQGRSMAIAGIACGAVGLILPVILLVAQVGSAFYGGR